VKARSTLKLHAYEAIPLLRVSVDNHKSFHRFQVITEHPARDFIFDPTYLGIKARF
jgi:hypothetical protein